MTIANSIFSRSSDYIFDFRIPGQGLSGAAIEVYFKHNLNLANDDAAVIVKGSASPLTGVTLSTATDVLMVGAIELSPDDFALLPAGVKTLYYDFKVRDATGKYWQVEDGITTVKMTAKA